MYDLTATWPVPSEIHKGALMEHKKVLNTRTCKLVAKKHTGGEQGREQDFCVQPNLLKPERKSNNPEGNYFNVFHPKIAQWNAFVFTVLECLFEKTRRSGKKDIWVLEFEKCRLSVFESVKNSSLNQGENKLKQFCLVLWKTAALSGKWMFLIKYVSDSS